MFEAKTSRLVAWNLAHVRSTLIWIIVGAPQKSPCVEIHVRNITFVVDLKYALDRKANAYNEMYKSFVT